MHERVCANAVTSRQPASWLRRRRQFLLRAARLSQIPCPHLVCALVQSCLAPTSVTPAPIRAPPVPFESVFATTGLAPEYVEFREAGMVAGDGAHYNLLRPEALEAMFVLWRVTQKPKYRDWAWAMFQAFEKHCKARPRSELC